MQFEAAQNYILLRLHKELPPYLTYHNIGHVMDVCRATERIAIAEKISPYEISLLLTAAAYHDSGFIISDKDHEANACLIAAETLPQFEYTPAEIDLINAMIRSTAIPQKPQNRLEEIICDADLDYLGRDDFFPIGHTLFNELKHFGVLKTELEWNLLQVRFLEQHHYFTATAIKNRKQKKEQHLLHIKQILQHP
ncbi:MAG: phosphohydrolase [Chitinophagia bacterium]|nr:phosphohydrolase [Chitinophagia bacterium]